MSKIATIVHHVATCTLNADAIELSPRTRLLTGILCYAAMLTALLHLAHRAA
jgi:hypothetical protein